MDIRKRLETDLKEAVSRLRYLGGKAALEEILGPSGAHLAYADEVDEIQASERREIGFATLGITDFVDGDVNNFRSSLKPSSLVIDLF